MQWMQLRTERKFRLGASGVPAEYQSADTAWFEPISGAIGENRATGRIKGGAGRETVSVETLTDWRAVEAQEDAWRALSQRGHLFSEFDWQMAWKDHFAADVRPYCVQATRGGRTVALLPLLRGWSRWRRLPVRQLYPAINGQSPWSGVVAQEADIEVCHALWRHLLARRDWDIIRLGPVPEASAPAYLFQEAARAFGLVTLVSEEQVYTVPLSETWPAFLASRSGNFRKSLKRSVARLENLGQVTVETCVDPQALPDALEMLLDIETRSWKQARGETICDDGHLMGFYQRLVQAFGSRDACWITLIFVDRRPVSGALCFLAGGEAYGLKTFFASDLASNAISPGLIAVSHALEEAHRRHATMFHFLSGSKGWARCECVPQRVVTRVAYHPSLYGRLLGAEETMLRRLRIVDDMVRIEAPL